MKNINCDGTIQPAGLQMNNSGWRMLARFAPAAADAAMSHFAVMCEWQRRAEMRAHIARLDDHQLADIGLSRDDVKAEVAKPFWQD